MTNKQTPGPWYKSTSENGLAVICHRNSDGDERVIARMSSRQEIGDEVPDADLIAAAPELLEALQLLKDVGCFEHGMLGNHRDILNAVDKSLAAIAKATGEAQ